MVGACNLPPQVKTARGGVRIATSHLESPIPPFRGPQMNSESRRKQLSSALAQLSEDGSCRDVVFAGMERLSAHPAKAFLRGWCRLTPLKSVCDGSHVTCNRSSQGGRDVGHVARVPTVKTCVPHPYPSSAAFWILFEVIAVQRISHQGTVYIAWGCFRLLLSVGALPRELLYFNKNTLLMAAWFESQYSPFLFMTVFGDPCIGLGGCLLFQKALGDHSFAWSVSSRWCSGSQQYLGFTQQPLFSQLFACFLCTTYAMFDIGHIMYAKKTLSFLAWYYICFSRRCHRWPCGEHSLSGKVWTQLACK